MKKKLIQVFTLVSLLLSGVLFLTVKTASYEVFPVKSHDNVFYQTYHESLDSGYSESSVTVVPKTNKEDLIFTYTLSKDNSIQEPFAALFFYRKDSLKPFFDLSDFNTISLEFSSFRGKRIPITFTLNYEGFTDKDKLLSNLPLTYLLDYESPGVYDLNLQDFEIPSWWLRAHNLKKEDLTNIDFSRVNYIVVGSCRLLERGVEDKITISSVRLHTDNSAKFILYGIILIVSASGLFIFRLLKREKIVVPYSKVEIQEKYGEASSKTEAVVNYVANHYANPELSLNEIQQALGITSREIGTIFKNEFGSSFKKYLNLVRLTEV
ncbi:MAG: hypothetical protein ACJA0Q_000930, partial [Saprospiraceae bacterium]